MEEFMSIGTNIATLIAIGVSVVSGIVVAFAGFQYATASGDPQKVQLAKGSFIGAFIGLIIASLAFIGPRIVTDMVIKPVGGVAMETQVGQNCDNILRNQLIFQRGASTADRMQVVIAQIQNQQQECASDVWDPEVIDMEGAVTAATGAVAAGASGSSTLGQCYITAGGFTGVLVAADNPNIGDQALPDSLMRVSGAGKHPRTTSGRDSENNIIVYWADEVEDRPSDAASCWLYYSRLRAWHENFVQ